MKSHAAWLGAGVATVVMGTTACQARDPTQQDAARTPPEQQVESAQASALEVQRPLARGSSPALTLASTAAPRDVSTQSAPVQRISGEVLSANAREVLLSERGEPRLRLQVGPNTQVRVDGRAASAADIREGSEVRASYRTDESSGEPRALSIDATTPTRPATPAPVESGESSPGVPHPP
ncbi:hypothetical protein [Corallococcus sp. Z5C101001]|uniref:hypothetical protein n=1 Tax=Corallococcus sp. Z5C101001 TaxID=2596829 RepID=UPI00210518EB|nr:hypothetical protein [Corallococcus sp. Z5C101001]